MLGNLTIREIDKLLQEELIGRLGYSSGYKTYVVPIAFVFEGDYIYGHSREGHKVQIMRRNPNVCLEVDRLENLSNWESAVVHGEYQEMLGQPAKEALELLYRRLKPHLLSEKWLPPLSISHLHKEETSPLGTVIFRIKITEKTGRFERL